MGFLKVIVYIICIFTPPFGWVILYLMMKDNKDKKEAKQLVDRLSENTDLKKTELFYKTKIVNKEQLIKDNQYIKKLFFVSFPISILIFIALLIVSIIFHSWLSGSFTIIISIIMCLHIPIYFFQRF